MAISVSIPKLQLRSRSDSVLEFLRHHPIASSLPVRVGVLLSVYWWLEKHLNAAGKLPAEAYEQPVILWQCLKGDTLEAVLFLVAPLIAITTARGRRGWRGLANYRATRGLVVLLAVMLAWGFSTYNYNHFFDQSHLADRILLVLFAIGCWFHPAFAFPALLQTIALANQFQYPIGQFSWTDKIMPIRVLILFAASLVTVLIWRRRVARDFTLVAACIIAAHYFIPGVAKAELGWWENNPLHLLAANAYANGWMHWIEPDSFQRIVGLIEQQNSVGVWMTLLLEVGAVAMLLRRRIAMGFLVGWILLHVGILVTSGICFWKWILLDAGFLVYLMRSSEGLRRWLFATPRFAMSVLLIGLSGYIFEPIWLGWHDTCVSYTFEFVGRGDSGKTYQISKEALAPYDFYFSQNRLFFLTDHKRLTETYGATQDTRIAERLSHPDIDPEELLAIEAQLGSSQFDLEKSERCHQFLERFFGTWNQRLGRTNSTALRAPLHIWTHRATNSYHGQEPLAEVQVHLTTWLYDRQRGIVPVSRQLVQEVAVKSGTDHTSAAALQIAQEVGPTERR